MKTKYVITGVDRNGKRFAPIYTDKPQHFNIWKGTVWAIEDEQGTRRKVASYYN